MPKLLQNMPGVTVEKIRFDKDHLHTVMAIPPKHSIASVMGKLKSQSSSLLRKKFTWLSKVFWKDNIVWSPGYFVSSVGKHGDEAMIGNDVKNQSKEYT